MLDLFMVSIQKFSSLKSYPSTGVGKLKAILHPGWYSGGQLVRNGSLSWGYQRLQMQPNNLTNCYLTFLIETILCLQLLEML